MRHLGKMLDRLPSGRPFPSGFGIQLVHMDTIQMKDLFHYRLSQAMEHGPQAAYLHAKTGDDYAAQILAEVKERDERGVESWVNPHGRDNHLLDCEVICHAAADPEFPGGGIHLIRPAGDRPAPRPAARREGSEKGAGNGFKRPGWLNR